MKEWLKESFIREKVLGLCLDNPRRRVKILNLRAIHRDQVQNLLAHPRLFDHHNRLDLVHPRLVLPLEVELHWKDALVVINLILDLAVPLKCAFSVDRRAMLGDFARCLILLLQWDKLWGSQEL